MSSGARVPFADALRHAEVIRAALASGCDRIQIAGSLRRLRPDVGDIEILAVPRTHAESLAEGMFESREVVVDELQVSIDLALIDGVLANHPDDPKPGTKYSKLIHAASGIQVDVFSARVETWGVALLIRTGPAAFSERFVTEIKRAGWHVGKGFELHRGALKCDQRLSPCEAVPTPDEDSVAAITGWTFPAPEFRA